MQLMLNFLLLVVRLLDVFITPVFKYLSIGKRRFLPPIKDELLRISATEVARKIRKKEVSSESICAAYIDRIKEVNPTLNAVVENRFLDALMEAKTVDEYLLKTSLSETELEKIKPLLGVPFTVKEACSVKGMSICVGTKARIGYKATADGECIARIRSCGAIPLLVSNTPEMCVDWESNNLVTGSTRNPYDTTCTSGGSSGGEGALLGAGASLVGVGSDFAGSIRLPSMFNGVFGHKPSPRIVPRKGHYPWSPDERNPEILTIGPLTRYAIDLRLMMKVMMGNKLSTELQIDEPVELSALKVYFMLDFDSVFLPPVDKSIKTAINRAVVHLSTVCGAKVEDYKFKDLNKSLVICGSHLSSLKDIPNPLKWENANLAIEIIKALIGRSKFSFGYLHYRIIREIYAHIGNYHDQHEKMKTDFKEILGQNGIFIMPTFHKPAFKLNQLITNSGGISYLTIASSLGLPSTNVPCGFTSDGMPIGLQILAGPYQDRLCLAVAEELERYFGGWIPPPTERPNSI